MKLRNLFPLMLIAGELSAQDAADLATPAGNADKEPPKALIIQEDDEVDVQSALDDSSSEAPVKNTSSDTNADLDPDSGDHGELSAQDPPVVKKEVNEGIQIQVEKSNSGSGTAQGGQEVEVTSPWRAKPLDTPPLGWKYIPAPSGVAPYQSTVKLGDHRSVNLSITPYVLVPASDGLNVIRIMEPGYQPDQDHLENDTIGSILKRSTSEIENNEKRAAQAILRLQQLLSSLPK